MRLGYLLAGLGLLIFVISCNKNDGDFENSLSSVAQGECKSLQNGADHFSICADQLHDSRCPEDVICITGGMAWAKFTVTVNNNSHSFFMNPLAFSSSHGSYPTDTTIGGFKIEFLDIIPHRRMDVPNRVQKARVKVTKP